jgi:hypothetical protein
LSRMKGDERVCSSKEKECRSSSKRDWHAIHIRRQNNIQKRDEERMKIPSFFFRFSVTCFCCTCTTVSFNVICILFPFFRWFRRYSFPSPSKTSMCVNECSTSIGVQVFGKDFMSSNKSSPIRILRALLHNEMFYAMKKASSWLMSCSFVRLINDWISTSAFVEVGKMLSQTNVSSDNLSKEFPQFHLINCICKVSWQEVWVVINLNWKKVDWMSTKKRLLELKWDLPCRVLQWAIDMPIHLRYKWVSGV